MGQTQICGRNQIAANLEFTWYLHIFNLEDCNIYFSLCRLPLRLDAAGDKLPAC